jgi:hypothetical protein
MDEGDDDLDELIEDRTKQEPDFPKKLAAAEHERAERAFVLDFYRDRGGLVEVGGSQTIAAEAVWKYIEEFSSELERWRTIRGWTDAAVEDGIL